MSTQSTKLEQARAELSKLPTNQVGEFLKLYEMKRRETCFVKYWDATPAQKKAIAEFGKDIKTFVVRGGNRSGKTELGAFITVAWALGKEYFRDEPAWELVKDLPIPEPPNNIWVVGLDFPTLRDVIWREKLRYGRNHAPLVPREALSKDPNDSDYQIFFANGSVITGKSADSGREKFQSASIDLVWIDEEPEAGIYDECYQRTVDCGGKLLVTLTPLTDIASGVREPWVYDLYETMLKGKKDVAFAKLSVLDNPWVPEIEKQKLQEKWAGHPEESARLFGDFVQRSGLIYNTWRPEKHLVQPFPIPRDWLRVGSIDPANTGTTAVVWLAVEPGTNNYYLYREYYQSNLTISEHVKNITLRNRGDMVDFWLIDPKWGSQREGQTHKTGARLYQEAGLPVRLAEVDEDYGVNVSKEYVNATVDVTSRSPKLFVFNDLHNFRHEIEHYTWAVFTKGEMKGLSKEKPVKRNDHLMNAFQYACAMRFKARMRKMYVDDATKMKNAQNQSYT